MHISEEFLHFVWKNKLLGLKFQLQDGNFCEILHPGYGENMDGPDFEDARIIINGILLAGNVEIHLKSSDWYRHKHQNDESYGKVILHVVLHYDDEVFDLNKIKIPVLVLNKEKVLKWKDVYESLRLTIGSPFICAENLKNVSESKIHVVLESIGAERMVYRAAQIKIIYENSNYNWDETFYSLLMRAFGLDKNTAAMEMLVSVLPWRVLSREKEQLLSVESLLFGQAGLLEIQMDGNDYIEKLQREYRFLKHKHKLLPLSKQIWKYAPVRPPAMPDLRLAQIAAFFNTIKSLSGTTLSILSKADWYALFSHSVSDFWRQHYTLSGKKSTHKNTIPGTGFLDLILINTVVPFMIAWADLTGQESYRAQAFDLVKSCDSEKNKIIATFVKELQVKPVSALESQGLIGLYKQLCKTKQCLKCPFIKDLMKTGAKYE